MAESQARYCDSQCFGRCERVEGLREVTVSNWRIVPPLFFCLWLRYITAHNGSIGKKENTCWYVSGYSPPDDRGEIVREEWQPPINPFGTWYHLHTNFNTKLKSSSERVTPNTKTRPSIFNTTRLAVFYQDGKGYMPLVRFRPFETTGVYATTQGSEESNNMSGGLRMLVR